MKETTPITLNHKLSEIQTKFKSQKSNLNAFGKYKYRSAENILEALKPFLMSHNVTVFTTESLGEACGLPILTCTAAIVCCDTGDAVSVDAIVAVDLNMKGMAKPQQFGAASSYAKKYALGNLLLIDDSKDADTMDNSSKVSMDSTQYAAATKFVKDGGKLSAIKAKYSVTPDQELALKTL